MNKLLLSTLMFTAFSVCTTFTSSYAEETREEMIERVLSLPPEPDKELNNSTVEGVDSNGNGVRDDIERKIAFRFYPDSQKLTVLNGLAKNNRETIRNLSNPEALIELYYKGIPYLACKTKLLTPQERYDFEKKIMLIYNTEERMSALRTYNSIKELHTIDRPTARESFRQCDNLLKTLE